MTNKMPIAYPEKYRERHPHMTYMNMFVVNSRTDKKAKLVCIASDGLGWDHVSITVKRKNMTEIKRCPTWEEMCQVKDLFFEKSDLVVQFHPPESEYVNNHPHCLHLWRSHNQIIQLPNSLMVGIKSDNIKS